jgi:hypothetical protein
MLNLQTLKVHIHKQDIASIVLSLTMFETIKGNLRGSMVVQDNINFMDTFMVSSQQAPIRIEWQYQSYLFINNFYSDGIEKMEISKLGKKYTIHFLTYTTMNNQLNYINESFSGRGDEIIHQIFREANPLPFGSKTEGRFYKDSTSITEGTYIAPNIKVAKALNTVVNSCYDINKSPLLLYQRLSDEGATRLTSLHRMSINEFSLYNLIGTMTQRTTFKLKAALAGANEESDGINSELEIGTVSEFVMEEFNKNFISKISQGFYGNKVQQISIDKTQTKNMPPAELTSIPSTTYKLQDNLYENDAKSIFSTSCEPESYTAQSQKRRIFNMRMSAMNTVAIPGLSCGYCIETDSGGSNLSKSKTDTKYIILSVQHRFQLHDGEFQYAQDIQLIRDGSKDI